MESKWIMVVSSQFVSAEPDLIICDEVTSALDQLVAEGALKEKIPTVDGPGYHFRLEAAAKESQRIFILDWEVIAKSMDTLMKIAPPELRSDYTFLERLYEQKRALKEIIHAERKAMIDAMEESQGSSDGS